MFLVDSSVWIDFFKGRTSPQTDFLTERMLDGRFLVGDLILVEVLQGASSAREFDRLLRLLSAPGQIVISDRDTAIRAAHHYRALRSRGITVRKTIDALIATRCILDRLPLLFADKDFAPFVTHLGLIDAMEAA